MNPYLLRKRIPCDECRHHAGRPLTFNGTSFLPAATRRAGGSACGLRFGRMRYPDNVLIEEGRDWVAAEQALRAVLAIAPMHKEALRNLEMVLRRQDG